ncbi:MAG: YwaF family protein [Solobacterium sp.]|nr:YwaF family protein [Solobacterium sp.]
MSGTWITWLKSLLEALAFRMEVPALLSPFHLILSSSCIIAAYALSSLMMRRHEKAFFAAGVVLACAEVFKQLFMWLIEGGGTYSCWWLPFQLCSMPMYILCSIPFLNSSQKQTAYTFLSSYGLIAAILAFAWPQDMLRSYVVMTAHSFGYHAVFLAASFTCVRKKLYGKEFLPCLKLFFLLAACAEVLNLCFPEANMFYISPHHPSLQPFFSILAAVSVWLEIPVYLGLLSVSAWLLHRIFIAKQN